MKATRRGNRKKKRWSQHDFEVQFTKTITDVTGTSDRRRNGDTHVGYSGRATVRREQCDILADIRDT
jgi:hypothetical protein